jgi:hypothetical protein
MWLKSMLKDGHDGSISSKRVVTFLAFLLCGIAFISNLFWGYHTDIHLYDSMSYIAMVGLSATVAEKFASKQKGIL